MKQKLQGSCWTVRPCSPEQCICAYVQYFIKVSVSHLPNTWLLTKDQGSTLNWIMLPICGSDTCWKIVPSWCRKSGPVNCLQDGYQENTRCQNHSTLESTCRHTCLSNTFLTKEEIPLEILQCAAYCYQETDRQLTPFRLHLRGSVHHK